MQKHNKKKEICFKNLYIRVVYFLLLNCLKTPVWVQLWHIYINKHFKFLVNKVLIFRCPITIGPVRSVCPTSRNWRGCAPSTGPAGSRGTTTWDRWGWGDVAGSRGKTKWGRWGEGLQGQLERLNRAGEGRGCRVKRND